MSPFPRGIPVQVGPPAEVVAGWKRKKAAIEQMCNGAKAFLSADIDELIERISRPMPASVNYYTPDMLVEATDRRDSVQRQIDALHEFVKELPGKQADFIREMQLPMLEDNLKNAEVWLTQIQAGLELASQHFPSVSLSGIPAQPTYLYVVNRDAPGMPGMKEIAENPDGSVKAYALFNKAEEAARAMGEGWTAATLVLHPVPAGLADTSTETATSPKQKESL